MSDTAWLEMPLATGRPSGAPARPGYPVEGSALLIYRGDKVYLASRGEAFTRELLEKPDVRWLSEAEARTLEASLPGVGAARLHSLGKARGQSVTSDRRILLGDLISRVTAGLGISECSACGQRKRKLNRITVWRSRAR